MPLVYPQNTPPRFATGLSDYRELREGGFVYVDKTMFIAEVLNNGNKAMVVPRPRRFGKTLNMSTLRYFLERSDEDLTPLFDGTAIWEADEGRYRQHFQRYPVVYLSFKDVKAATWSETADDLRVILHEEIRRLIVRHGHLGDHPSFRQVEALLAPEATPAQLKWTLRHLTTWLHAITDEPVVILTDEYDAPLHAAHDNGYWEEAVRWFGRFLSNGYKDRSQMYRGVITGILKIAKENIFSDLNNPTIRTVLSARTATAFGFTEDEVDELVTLAERSDQLDEIRRWYNGYRFGVDGKSKGTTIYNPWSVLTLLVEAAEHPAPYWINTSANVLIRDLLVRQAASHAAGVEALLRGECVVTEIDDNLELRRVTQTENALWSLLLFSGYLTVHHVEHAPHAKLYHLGVPNEEVHRVYRKTFVELLAQAQNANVTRLLNAMLSGDALSLQDELSRMLATIASYHDFVGKAPEAVYHAFVLGLIAHLSGTHVVRSNREAGHGRADLLVLPKQDGGVAVVLELKVARLPRRWKKRWGSKDDAIEDTLDASLVEAIEQVHQRDYVAEVADYAPGAVHAYAVAFHKKRCLVTSVGPEDAPS